MSIFATTADAETWFENSGFSNWEWFEGFDEHRLIEFLWRNSGDYTAQRDSSSEFDGERAISAWLRSQGQNPADYNL
ncbi:hypothetical protein [Ralstonia pseudosolanacearum]